LFNSALLELKVNIDRYAAIADHSRGQPGSMTAWANAYFAEAQAALHHFRPEGPTPFLFPYPTFSHDQLHHIQHLLTNFIVTRPDKASASLLVVCKPTYLKSLRGDLRNDSFYETQSEVQLTTLYASAIATASSIGIPFDTTLSPAILAGTPLVSFCFPRLSFSLPPFFTSFLCRCH
jgi:hypothetical protein